MPQLGVRPKRGQAQQPEGRRAQHQARRQDKLVAPVLPGADQQMHSHHAHQDAIGGVNPEAAGLRPPAGPTLPRRRRSGGRSEWPGKRWWSPERQKRRGPGGCWQKLHGGPQVHLAMLVVPLGFAGRLDAPGPREGDRHHQEGDHHKKMMDFFRVKIRKQHPAEGRAHDKTQQGQNPHHGQGPAPVPLRNPVHQEGVDGGGGHGGADAEEGKQEHPLIQQGAAVGLGSQVQGQAGKNGMTATLRSMPPQM